MFFTVVYVLQALSRQGRLDQLADVGAALATFDRLDRAETQAGDRVQGQHVGRDFDDRHARQDNQDFRLDNQRRVAHNTMNVSRRRA